MNQDLGRGVGVVARTNCSGMNSVAWSLDKVDGGRLFTVVRKNKGRNATFGKYFLPESDFQWTTEPEPVTVQLYKGPHDFIISDLHVCGADECAASW
jgi:hypothetical protein